MVEVTMSVFALCPRVALIAQLRPNDEQKIAEMRDALNDHLKLDKICIDLRSRPNLSWAEKAKLADLKNHQVLTPDQRKMIEDFIDSHKI